MQEIIKENFIFISSPTSIKFRSTGHNLFCLPSSNRIVLISRTKVGVKKRENQRKNKHILTRLEFQRQRTNKEREVKKRISCEIRDFWSFKESRVSYISIEEHLFMYGCVVVIQLVIHVLIFILFFVVLGRSLH